MNHEGTRLTSLGELLTEEQITRVVAILRQGQGATELKAYLSQFRAALEAKGVLPEYLAYWLEANRSKFLSISSPSRN